MGVHDILRRRQVILPIVCLATLYLFITYLTDISLPGQALFRTEVKPICEDPEYQWRGANDRLYPLSGSPVNIRHNDYSDGLINHDVSIYMARSQSEDFFIQVEIHTSHPLPQDNFEITYQHDDLIINTMVPKADPLVTEDISRGDKHCVRVKVHLMLPVSKPLTGIKLDFPKANFFIHDSTWAALPTLEANIGEGVIVGGKEQRLHIGSTTIRLDKGRIEGKYMISKELTIALGTGDIDLDIGYSTDLVGAVVDVQQQSGTQKISIEDLWYRHTTATYALQRGTMKLDYPKSYNGLITIDARNGKANLQGAGVDILEQSAPGVKPIWIQARQGKPLASTKVRIDNGNVVMKVDAPDRLPATIEQD